MTVGNESEALHIYRFGAGCGANSKNSVGTVFPPANLSLGIDYCKLIFEGYLEFLEGEVDDPEREF